MGCCLAPPLLTRRHGLLRYCGWVDGAMATGHTEAVLVAAFSPDGRQLATGGGDATLRLWDILTETPLATITGHTNWILCAAWYPLLFPPPPHPPASHGGAGEVARPPLHNNNNNKVGQRVGWWWGGAAAAAAALLWLAGY